MGSYPAWKCTLAASRIHRLLLFGVGLASGVALFISRLPLPVQVLGCLGIILWVAHLWRQLSQPRVLQHNGGPDDVINDWTFVDPRSQVIHGALVNKGYRSSGLLILAIRAADGSGTYRIPVWRDSVSTLEFSYLNLQLLFNTDRT